MSSITVTCLEYWKSLLIEFSATPFPFTVSLSLAQQSEGVIFSELKYNQVPPLFRTFHCVPISFRVAGNILTQAHKTLHGLILAIALLSFMLLSQTGLLAISQSHHTRLCLRATALTTVQPGTFIIYCVQSHTIFFPW